MFPLPSRFLLLFLPLMFLQLGLMIGAVISIAKKDDRELRFNSKVIWLIIVIFVNIIGPILYFIFGANDRNNDNNTGGYNNDYYNK